MSKQEQSRRSIRLPQKTGINMNMREKRTGKYVTVIVGVCLILLCAGLVAKFGVIDQYRRLSDAQGAYTRVHQQYVDTETQLEDYDRILAEYRTYSMDWMTGSEDSKKNYVAVDRHDPGPDLRHVRRHRAFLHRPERGDQHRRDRKGSALLHPQLFRQHRSAKGG